MADLKYLTLKVAHEYVFTTQPIGAIKGDVSLLLQRFITSTYSTLVALAALLYYALLFAFKLLILAFPHAMKLAKQVYRFHRTQLTTYDLLIEFTVLGLVVLFLVFRRRITSAWHRFEAYVSVKSQAAARAAPHVAFFTAAALLAVLGRKFILPLTSPAAMPIFTLIIPLVNTVRYLRSAPQEENRPAEAQKPILVLWTVLALYHGLVTAAGSIPFSSRLLRLLPYLKELVMVILIWIQLSPVFTQIVFTSVIQPLLCRLSAVVPTAQSFENKVAGGSSMLSLLQTMRLLSESQSVFLSALLQDALVSLMALLCIFMPSPFASLGMVTIAMLLPAFRTVALLDSLTLRLTARGRQLASAEGDRRLVSAQRHWLLYWICISLLWLWRIYVMVPWPSVCILLSLWLQHAYFRGAKRATRFARELTCSLRERHNMIDEERQRALQQREEEGEGEGMLLRHESSGRIEAFELTTPEANAIEQGQGQGQEQEAEAVPEEEEQEVSAVRSPADALAEEEYINVTASASASPLPASEEAETLEHTEAGNNVNESDLTSPAASRRRRSSNHK